MVRISVLFLSFVTSVHCQSHSSCLVQRRTDASRHDSDDIEESPAWQESVFSEQQKACIKEYAATVDADLPGFSARFRQRKFGGVGMPAPDDLTILAAGFGTTATRSLSLFGRQLGLQVHHYKPDDNPQHFWLKVDELVNNQHLDGFEGCVSDLNKINFSEPFADAAGRDYLLVDTPMAEQFLDFYAISPNSKVVLTLRDATEWVLGRTSFNPELAAPVHDSCGVQLTSLEVDAATRLVKAHDRLVRCMVPPEKLLEINVFNGTAVDTGVLTEFLGRGRPEFPSPFPRYIDSHHVEGHRVNAEMDVGICITGQIRRLELQTKVDRLIRPLQDAGYRVGVALVIDPREETNFIHRHAGLPYGNFTVELGNFTNLQQAVDTLPHNITVIADAFIPHDYPVDDRYVWSMFSKQPEKGIEYAQSRARSHMRQWEALDRCSELLLHHFKAFSIRLRDDSAVLEPFVLPAELEEGSIYVPSCAPCGGLNDKFALAVGHDSALKYYTSPLAMMRSNFELIQESQRLRSREPLSPEAVLQNSLDLANISVKRFMPAELPIVPSKFLQAKNGSHYLCVPAQGENFVECYSDKIWHKLNSRGVQVLSSNHNFSRPDFLCEPDAVNLASFAS
mmetsp:Transcript_29868/g.55975  ORF Transcript_29868/g.55975 Transcript_29868/m.55975 type:complete len:621 (-) Transcript_29868:307-2169(-)